MRKKNPEHDQGKLSIRIMDKDDLPAIVEIDRLVVHRNRPEYYRKKIRNATQQSFLNMSLVAEIDGKVVGFVMGELYYGEFGILENTALIDTIGVRPDFQRRGVAGALLEQLQNNFKSIGMENIQLHVAWEQQDLLRFFYHQGFTLAPRICLEKKVK